jgi:hypothetical protein
MGAQIFVLPNLDSIGGFTVLFIGVTILGEVAIGTGRQSGGVTGPGLPLVSGMLMLLLTKYVIGYKLYFVVKMRNMRSVTNFILSMRSGDTPFFADFNRTQVQTLFCDYTGLLRR